MENKLNVILQEDERLDHLLGESLRIIQSPNVFAFSLDAVLLANFTYAPFRKGKIVDLCTGNGAIPLFLSTRTKATIIGVEIQSRLADMARRSIQYNALEAQISIVQEDLKQILPIIGYSKYDVVTCNPPYFQNGDADQNKNEYYTIARHEVKCNLEDVIRVSSGLLKQGGHAAFVHRPGRLLDLLLLMRSYRLEPKRLQFVYPKAGKEANMILVEGIKDGRTDLKILPPFIVYQDNNKYTKEMERMIHGEWVEKENTKSAMDSHYFYVLRCSDDSYYAGYTNNLDNRLRTHNSGKGAKYTRGRTPVKLIFSLLFETKTEAMQMEYDFKQLNRQEKEEFIFAYSK